MVWIIPETGQHYTGERRTMSMDIPAITDPPSTTAIAVIQDGSHTGKWTEPPAPQPPPDWGRFATVLMACPYCEAWWTDVFNVRPWVAQNLRGAVTFYSPDALLVTAALNACVALVPPPAEFREAWNTAAAQYGIPVTIPGPIE